MGRGQIKEWRNSRLVKTFAEKIILGLVVGLVIVAINNPMGLDWQQRLFGVIGVLCLGYVAAHTIDKLSKPQRSPEKTELAQEASPEGGKAHRIDINQADVFVAKFIREGNLLSGNFGIGFWDIAITNSSPQNLTIKDVRFRYEFGRKKYEADRMYLTTADKGFSKSAISLLKKSGDTIVVSGWHNLSAVLETGQVVIPGAVVKGSAFYVLEVRDLKDLVNLGNMMLVVRDFSGGESFHPVTVSPDVMALADTELIN